MKLILILLSGIFMLSALSCKKDLTGSGTIITELRPESNFKSIVSNGDFRVTFKKANTYSLELKGEDNVIKQILTKVTDNKLSIEYKNGIQIHNHEQVIVTIGMPALENVQLNGSGSITTDDLWLAPNCKTEINGSGSISLRVKTDVLQASVSGSGKLKLEGESNMSKYILSGSGSIQAFNLQSYEANVTKEGSGKVETSVSNKLTVSLKGSGNVYYKGNPGVTSTIDGSGKVIKS